MKRFFLCALVMFIGLNASYAQLDVPIVATGGPFGAGSWLRFLSGGSSTSIQENWGLNLTGSNIQPIKVYNASLLVGYVPAPSTDFGVGNAFISGNVGVGTTSPGAKLHLQEDASSGATALKFTNRNSTQTYGLAVDVNSVDDAKFMIYNVNNNTPNLVINNIGNVAIGTTDPKGYKLAVAGDAIAESMTVDLQANWPDYVIRRIIWLGRSRRKGCSY